MVKRALGSLITLAIIVIATEALTEAVQGWLSTSLGRPGLIAYYAIVIVLAIVAIVLLPAASELVGGNLAYRARASVRVRRPGLEATEAVLEQRLSLRNELLEEAMVRRRLQDIVQGNLEARADRWELEPPGGEATRLEIRRVLATREDLLAAEMDPQDQRQLVKELRLHVVVRPASFRTLEDQLARAHDFLEDLWRRIDFGAAFGPPRVRLSVRNFDEHEARKAAAILRRGREGEVRVGPGWLAQEIRTRASPYATIRKVAAMATSTT